MVEPRNFSEFDEDDVRSRPARSTRPRTKDRPDYSKAATAFVVAFAVFITTSATAAPFSINKS